MRGLNVLAGVALIIVGLIATIATGTVNGLGWLAAVGVALLAVDLFIEEREHERMQ